MTVYLIISLPHIPWIHRVYTVYVLVCILVYILYTVHDHIFDHIPATYTVNTRFWPTIVILRAELLSVWHVGHVGGGDWRGPCCAWVERPWGREACHSFVHKRRPEGVMCMCLYVCACVRASVYVRVCECVSVCVYVCVLVCVSVCECMCVCAFINACAMQRPSACFVRPKRYSCVHRTFGHTKASNNIPIPIPCFQIKETC